jgi:ADP-heptose:LPS heptosyltransferase
LNFEPDIRSNLLLALSGAPRRVGFSSGGGGAFLTDALSYTPTAHTAANALRLIDAALPVAAGTAGPPTRYPRLPVPDEARREARRLLGNADAGRLLVGIHASGGRPIKQWHLDRFAQVATRLARDLAATIVLTGTPEDRPLVDRIISVLPADVTVLDVAGSMALPVFAGLLEQLSLFVTGDTGPMHLAAALGTPVVALFGPSDPGRYGPLTDRARVVTADLWCRPCSRVRRPPTRCVGHVPDCLNGIDVEAVCRAADDLLNEARAQVSDATEPAPEAV